MTADILVYKLLIGKNTPEQKLRSSASKIHNNKIWPTLSEKKQGTRHQWWEKCLPMNPKPRTWYNLEEKRLTNLFMMSVSSIMRRTKWYKITDQKTGGEKNRVQMIRPAVKAHQRRWAPEKKRAGLGPSPERNIVLSGPCTLMISS